MNDYYRFPLYIKGREKEDSAGAFHIARPITAADLALVRQQIDNALAVVATIENHPPPPKPKAAP